MGDRYEAQSDRGPHGEQQMLQTDLFAPLGGLVGEKMINVLQVNLELAKHYGAPQG
jgi:K+-transporting ATPase c subunit